jgi:primase-polymerase (primpol)-like protein
MPELTPSKPAILRAYGDSLVEYDQWICWTAKRRDGEWTKLPVDPETGNYAQTNDSTTWSTFDDAWAEYDQNDHYDGIGFVFAEEDPFVGVDLDHCVDPSSKEVEQWAKEIVGTTQAPTEASPSGTGLHLYLRGTLSGERNRNDDIGIELYDEVRYFTVTGRMFRGDPPAIPDDEYALAWLEHHYLPSDENFEGETDVQGDLAADDEPETDADTTSPSLTLEPTPGELENMDDDTVAPYPDHPLDDIVPSLAEGWYDHMNTVLESKKGERFENLWNGHLCDNPSQSEADMEFCCRLAFWFCHDVQAINTVFTTSGLYRSKWNRVHRADGATYGEMTIEKALNLVQNDYAGHDDPKGPLIRTSDSGPTSAQDPAGATVDTP